MANPSNIVFVIGAGASVDAGLPTGSQLRDRIVSKLDIKFEGGVKRVSGNAEILGSLREHVKLENGNRGDVNPHLHAAWHIVNALPQNISIDSFIDTQDDEKIELAGKLAIVNSILEAERKCRLYIDQSELDPNLNFKLLADTWYARFWELLISGCVKSNIKNKLQKMAFIIFNYDRCIEQFLIFSLKNYYRMNPGEIEDTLRALTIYHPYGSVGQLPLSKNAHGTPFGAMIGGKELLSHANKIKTYTEQFENELATREIRSLIQSASRLVFLGFAFHKQNMDLIRPEKPARTQRVYASVHGISLSDQTEVHDDIRRLLRTNPAPTINLKPLVCSSLFEEFSRSLSLT
jgi:hypothetical protein